METRRRSLRVKSKLIESNESKKKRISFTNTFESHEDTKIETQSDLKTPKVLLGLSGSVASIKAELLVKQLSQFAEVQVVTTIHAKHFFETKEIEKQVVILNDEDEWNSWKKMHDPVLHIELRKWADLIVIAPLSANTMAKLANGLSDNLLTCIARAWDFGRPFLVAPAMNTFMWDHPHTEKHLKVLKSLGIQIIPPISKVLACGDIGTGAMAEVSTIVEVVKQQLISHESSCTKKVKKQKVDSS